MGLHRFKPLPSGRMGVLWTLSTIRDAAVIEFGCMGHVMYSGVTLKRSGVYGGSKFYSTHISETDISLGDTSRIEKVVASVIKKDHPRAVFLTPSAVPEVIGTDLPAIARNLQKQYPDTPIIPFSCGGFNQTLTQGVGSTLTTLVKKLTRKVEKTKAPTFNIIGSCADLLYFQADAQEICRILKGAFGMDPLCVFSSNTSIDEIQNMGGAHMNLVIRQEGKQAATELNKRFGTPSLFGRPYGIEGTTKWLYEIANLMNLKINKAFLSAQQSESTGRIGLVLPNLQRIVRSYPEKGVLSIGGHIDVVKGILAYGCDEIGLLKGECWCDSPDIQSKEIPFYSEECWSKVLMEQESGWIMASGEALEWAGRNRMLQIANPDVQWRIYPYVAPLVGYRGAVQLANMWINCADEDD